MLWYKEEWHFSELICMYFWGETETFCTATSNTMHALKLNAQRNWLGCNSFAGILELPGHTGHGLKCGYMNTQVYSAVWYLVLAHPHWELLCFHSLRGWALGGWNRDGQQRANLRFNVEPLSRTVELLLQPSPTNCSLHAFSVMELMDLIEDNPKLFKMIFCIRCHQELFCNVFLSVNQTPITYRCICRNTPLFGVSLCC